MNTRPSSLDPALTNAPIPWEPAIYEHKAALIGRTPAEVSGSADLLVRAMKEEHAVYQADYLTVGMDIYNVEAEALGARLTVPGPCACPDLEAPIYNLEDLPKPLVPPLIPDTGRFRLFLEAGTAVARELGSRAAIRVAATGPFTLAARLCGLEPLLMSLAAEDGNADRLLDFTTGVAGAWCRCLREHALEVVLFDSAAAPPMVGPDGFARALVPRLARLMNALADSGQAERELVIGGDTSSIAALLPATGATFVLCDAPTDAQAFRQALGPSAGCRVRRNIAPDRLADDPGIREAAFVRDLAQFSRPVAGTGVLPYDFEPSHFLEFRERVMSVQVV